MSESEIINAVSAAREELARLSPDAKQHIYGLLADAFAELGTARAHVIAIGKKFDAVLSVEVAPLDTLGKIGALEQSLSQALAEKGSLLEQARALQDQVRTLLENNEAANKRIGDLEAQLNDALAKVKLGDALPVFPPSEAPAAEAPAAEAPAEAPAAQV